MTHPVLDHRGLPEGQISALVRDALNHALQRSPDSSAHVGSATEIAHDLSVLMHVVLTAAGEAEPDLAELCPELPARKILRAARRYLLGLGPAAYDRVDPRELVRALRGIDRVEAELERQRAQVSDVSLGGRSPLLAVAEVMHDLRSPLTAITMLANMVRLGQSGPVNHVQEQQLGIIYGAAFSLGVLANDICDLAEGAERLLEPVPVAFSVAALMRGTADIVRPLGEDAGLELRLVFPQRDHRTGHPTALARVLLNLVTNALKFTEKGYVEVSAAEVSDVRVRVAVKDTGPGIADEIVAAAFGPSQMRRNENDPQFATSGLGLSLCRRLVAAMGGKLRVEKPADGGTCFFFELDLPPAPA